MYRVILVDDEPLILAGIASLIHWEEHDCVIVGKATNGPAALDMIPETKPDIVITDIRMPVMNGLELIQKSREQGNEFSFIVLTNLEEFQLARQAVCLGAIDYLVKLDLSPGTLLAALERAKNACNLMESHHKKELYNTLIKDNARQVDESYFKQLLFSSKQADLFPPEDMDARYPKPFIISLSMQPENIQFDQAEEYDFHFIHQQLLDILSGISARYFRAYTVLNQDKTDLILVVSSKEETFGQKYIMDFCNKVNGALKTYFGLTAIFGISIRKDNVPDLPEAWEEALAAREYYYYDSHSAVVFYEGQTLKGDASRAFNINILKRPMSAAIAQNDTAQLREIFREVCELFAQYRPDRSQAVSACINIYTYLNSLFQTEDVDYKDIFPCTIDIADQLKQIGSLEDLSAWLDSFCEKLCLLLEERRENRSDKLIYLSKRYVNQHFQEKLTLSDVAEHLNISPGHLSNTFSKFMDMTLSDYIAQVKIEHARELIDTHQYLIYEVANMLGFDNAYYFSKVFKKVMGMSPRDYEQLQEQVCLKENL